MASAEGSKEEISSAAEPLDVASTPEISATETSAEEEAEAPTIHESLSYPLTDEGDTLTMFCAAPTLGPLTGRGGDYGINGYEDYASIQRSFELTGVTIDFENVSTMESSSLLALHIAAGDYDDLLSGIDLSYTGGAAAAYADDIVVDLSSYVEDYAPDYLNTIEANSDLEKSVVTDDGEILMLYFLYDKFIQAEGSIIRKDWLDQLGIETPSTVDELHEVMLAFKNEIGCDNPFYMNSGCNQLLMGFNLYNYVSLSDGDMAVYQEDGVVCSDFTSDRYQKWLETMNQWYAEGLIDPDFVSVSSTNIGGHDEDLLAEDNIGFWYGNVNSIDNYYTMCPAENFEIEPIYISYDGEKNHVISTSLTFGSSTGASGIAISSACENIDLALGWLNFWYTEEGYYLKNYGIEGDSYVLEDGDISYTDVVLSSEYGLVPAVALLLYSVGNSDFGVGAQDRTAYFYSPLQSEARDVWTDSCDGAWAYPNVTMTSEESSIISTKGGDILTYIAESVPKFIIGELDPETDWAGYVDTCNRLGINEILDAYQSALDRYNAK
jgi:putative aldouronate transport system substrate-binding protein